MKKKLIMISATVLVVVLALFAFTACNADKTEVGQELVQNGDFSSYDSSAGTLDNWYTSSNINYKIDQRTDGADDSGSVDNELILESSGTANSNKTYQYIYQRVAVDVNAIYKVSVEIKLSADINHDYGAYFTFLENTSFKTYRNTRTVVDGSDTATFITLTAYVRPKNTDYLTLALCMGDENGGAVGRVIFDNASVQRVDKSALPEGAEVHNIRKVEKVIDNTTVSGIIFTVLCTVGSAALLLAAYIIIKRIYANKNAFADFGTVDARYASSGTKSKWYQTDAFIVCMIALGALAVRAALMFTTFGNGSAMASTLSDARKLGVKNGVADFFQSNPMTTLSPGASYILAIVGAIGFKLDSRWVSVILRLINVLADVAIVAMVYFFGKKKVGNRLATVYSALYAILPFTFVLSGMNGSFESVLVALLLVSALLMLKKQYLPTYGVLTLAVVLDIRAFAVVPIVIAYFVYCYIKDDKDMRKFTSARAQIVFGVPAAFVAGYLLTLPAGFNMIKAGDAFANFKLIVHEMTQNVYFVHNAFNLYGMVAMNDKMVTNSVSILNLVFLLVLEAYVISLYFKNRNKNELLLLISFTLMTIAVFTVKVDYTYMFLGFVFALIYTMVSGDARMYGVLSGYGVFGILGIAQLFSQSGFITSSSAAASVMSYETTDPFYIIFCVLSVILTGYYVYVTYSITNNTKIVDITSMPEPFFKTVGKWMKNVKTRLTARKSAD